MQLNKHWRKFYDVITRDNLILRSFTPQRLIKPGIVVLGSRKCNYTQKIIDRLTAQGKLFTVEHIDNDKELNNYIVDEHKGGIPIVFENSVYQGTGKEYMNKQDGGFSQPFIAIKQ